MPPRSARERAAAVHDARAAVAEPGDARIRGHERYRLAVGEHRVDDSSPEGLSEFQNAVQKDNYKEQPVNRFSNVPLAAFAPSLGGQKIFIFTLFALLRLFRFGNESYVIQPTR